MIENLYRISWGGRGEVEIVNGKKNKENDAMTKTKS
jgi:hypothetical protein